MALQEIFGSEMDSISSNDLEISLERFHIAEKGIDLLQIIGSTVISNCYIFLLDYYREQKEKPRRPENW